jgi:hypothetical protein
MNFKSTAVLCLGFASLALIPAQAQVYTLTQTSLSSAVASGSVQSLIVASATNITVTPATYLYVDQEAMLVLGVSGTSITVSRGQNTTKAVGHASGAMVLAGSPDWFSDQDPQGSCVTASTKTAPHLNVISGKQWLCSTVTLTWVPGFGNGSPQQGRVTAAVASAAGAILPSGPLFHVTGTAAVTGFTIPVGFAYGSFCVIPDGAFTTTTAGNIAIASTAVVNQLDCWTWDDKNSKFVPTY